MICIYIYQPPWAALQPHETLSMFYLRVQTSLFYRLRRLNEIVQKGVRRKIFEKLREVASLEDQEASLAYARKSGARVFDVVTNEQASAEQKVARLAALGITSETDLRAFTAIAGTIDCAPCIDPGATNESSGDRELSEDEYGAARAKFFQFVVASFPSSCSDAIFSVGGSVHSMTKPPSLPAFVFFAQTIHT